MKHAVGLVLLLVAPVASRAAVVVHTAGCKIFVTTFIEISGAGASKKVARNIRNGIAACSPARTGGYSLGGCCKVVMRSKVRVRRASHGPRPGYSQVAVTSDPDFRSYVQGDGGEWSSAESAEVYAHEAAHLLGLDDEYVDGVVNGQEVSIVNAGHEMDKMGTTRGKFGIGIDARGKLDQALLRKGARCDPRRCCHETTTTTGSSTTTTLPGLRYCCVDHCPLSLGCILKGECTAALGGSCCTTDTALFIQVGSCADFVPTCTGCQ